MSKRKYESFTEEQARKVLVKCGGNHRSEDPKRELDRLIRDPPRTWETPSLKALCRGIGGHIGYRVNWWVELVDAIREGHFEVPLYKPFDRDRCVKEVRKITPCCDDVTGIILQYLLPIQYPPGTILRPPRIFWTPRPRLVVQHYTRRGRCCVKQQSDDQCFCLNPWGAGFLYRGRYYLPQNE